MLQKLYGLKGLFFNTPLIAIDLLISGTYKRIYAKYEALSFSGSIKDRMAYYLFEHAYLNNQLQPNQPIVEVTSGNTGISLSSLGRALGHQVHIVMPDWLSPERYQLMELAGAEIIKVSDREKGFHRSMEIAKELAQTQDMYYPDQFSNYTNALAHKETTAYEIDQALDILQLKLGRFVSATGSGGTIMGVSDYYLEKGHYKICHPVELESAPILSSDGYCGGSHKIQGVNGEFIADIINLNTLGEVVTVDEKHALSVAYHLNRLGLSVGLSSGANLLAAIKLAQKHPNDVIVTTIADSALKYLSSDLCADRSNITQLPQELSLLGFSTIASYQDQKIIKHNDVQKPQKALQ